MLDPPQRYDLLHWIERGGALTYPLETDALTAMIPWMRRYTDRKREMHLADTSLYWLAVETGVREIMTVDTADFSRYRLPDGSHFELL